MTKYGLLAVALTACTKPNPNYHPDGATGIDASADGTQAQDDGPFPIVDAKPACKHELLVQRDGFFGQPQLVVVDADTYVERVISNGVDKDYAGEWSPDGSQIAFTRNAKSIWVTDADGQGGHELQSDPESFMIGPRWSHDGKRIAYAAGDPNGSTSEIDSASVTGATFVDLTPGMHADAPIAWSPTDASLLFVGVNGSDADVYLVGAAGGAQDLTNRSGNDGRTAVAWIDDSTVLFDAFHIWTMAADGSNQQNLTGTSHTEAQPAWAAATGKIYYVVSPPPDDSQIFVMNRNGTGQHQVTADHFNTDPNPSPDGTRLAFTSDRDGTSHIYVSGADGENPTRITNNAVGDSMPRWRPCP